MTGCTSMMLDKIIFLFTFIIASGMVSVLCGLAISTLVKPDPYMKAALINNAVSSAKDTVNIAATVPAEVLRWSASNIAYAVLFVLCLLAHYSMNNDEGKFLSDSSGIYKEFNDIFTYAILTPILSAVGVIYGATIPLFNFIFIPAHESLWGALQVLVECRDPLEFINALISVPITLGKFASAIANIFDTNGGTTSWMVNSIEISPAIAYFQTNVVQPMVDNAECLCQVMSPTFSTIGKIATSSDIANGIDAVINVVWRFVQVPFRFAAPQYHTLDFTPVFQELRDVGYHGGNFLDDCVQAFLTISTQSQSTMLPRPSLGMAAGRTWSAFWSALEIPIAMVAAAVGQQSMHKAADARHVFNNLYLAVQAGSGGANVLGELFTTGSPGTKAVLTCNSYDYDFYETHDMRFPTECMCIPGSCGQGICSADMQSCTCRPGNVHAVPGDLRSKCVPSCSKVLSLLNCNEPFSASNVIAGNCQADTGQCICNAPALLDTRTGRCSTTVPSQFQVSNVQPNCQHVQTTGPPLPCVIQSSAMSVVGLLYVVYDFTREVLLQLPAKNTLWDNMQKYDGVWYSRFDSVTCEYRKNFKDDFTINTLNCRCQLEPGDEKRLELFDPWCSQPTLNANVYNHLDALAFYGGYWSDTMFFTGGMGTYSTFLSDSFGLAATTAARSVVELGRVTTHAIAGFVTYATSMMASISGNLRATPNLLQKPINCDWGPAFDGPLKPTYASASDQFYEVEHENYLRLQTLCSQQSKCSTTVNSAIRNWPSRKDTFLRYSPAMKLSLLNNVHDALVIQEERASNNCRDRSHTWGIEKCQDNNNQDDCYCNVALEWRENFKCRCVAFFPDADVSNSDAHLSHLYQNLPWCHSMMLEWTYYRVLELSVAAHNLMARLDSPNPISVELDSPCYDDSNNYVLSQTHSVIKAFQPSPRDDGSFVFIGNQRTKLDNKTICQSLSVADEGKPQWIHFEDGLAQFPPQGQPPLAERVQAWREAPLVDYAAGNLEWQAFAAKYPSPRPGYNELTTKVYRLHPQTCSYAAKGDTLVFQPCAHSCRTPGGNNRCWCDITVSNDITCNVGQLIRDTVKAGVDRHRQLTTAIISVSGLIKGGMRINYAQGLCDLSRVIGSMCGAIASILTGQLGGTLATSIRFRIATLLFTVFDTLMMMPLGSVAGNMDEQEDELEDMEGEDALQSAALATMYQDLFQDMFAGDSNSAVVDIATLAGSLVANGMVIQVKFGCIAACNALSGVQDFIFAHDATAPGADIIPTIEDFVNVVIGVLDEVYTNFVIMAANMVAGFVGMVTGGPPTIGEWIDNALDVLQKVLSMVNAPKHAITFLGIIISMLPDFIRPIAVALMTTMCHGILVPLDFTLDALNSIDILGFGFNVYNPFEEMVKGCLNEGDLTPIHSTGDGNSGFSRRRLFEEPEHWEGDTFCAHYGRSNHTHDEHYDQCVRNRRIVADLRYATGRDYYPWTLMDDWKEPALFAAQTLHGVIMYYAIGEPRMRLWEKAGYPVDASMDIVHGIQSMKFPEMGLQGFASVVPQIYPDYRSNNRSTGYQLMRVLDTVNRAQFPSVLHLPWDKLHDAAHSAVVETMSSVTFSLPPQGTQHSNTTGSSSTPVTRRRLFSVTQASADAVSAPTSHVECNEDDSGVCIHCALLQKIVSSFKLVSVSTANYYSDVYPEQVTYFKDVLSYAQRGKGSQTFNFVSTEQYATNAQATFLEQPPVAKMQYQSHSIKSLPTMDEINAFFLPQNNINDPVPYFGHSFWYYVQYPLRPCRTWRMAYGSCDEPKYSLTDAAVMTMHIWLVLQLIGWVTGLYVPFAFKVPLLLMCFLIFRYDYVPRCLPVMPWCLIIDLQRLLHNIFPPHLCELVPAMVVSSCTPGTQEYATYRSCPRSDLGILEPWFFMIRWKFPTLFVNLFAHADWGPQVNNFLEQIDRGDEVTSLQTTCFYLAFFDVIIVFIMLVIAARLAVPVAQAAITSTISATSSLAISVPYLLENKYPTEET